MCKLGGQVPGVMGQPGKEAGFPGSVECDWSPAETRCGVYLREFLGPGESWRPGLGCGDGLSEGASTWRQEAGNLGSYYA